MTVTHRRGDRGEALLALFPRLREAAPTNAAELLDEPLDAS